MRSPRRHVYDGVLISSSYHPSKSDGLCILYAIVDSVHTPVLNVYEHKDDHRFYPRGGYVLSIQYMQLCHFLFCRFFSHIPLSGITFLMMREFRVLRPSRMARTFRIKISHALFMSSTYTRSCSDPLVDFMLEFFPSISQEQK